MMCECDFETGRLYILQILVTFKYESTTRIPQRLL